MPKKKTRVDYRKEVYILRNEVKEYGSRIRKLKDYIRTLEHNQAMLKAYTERAGTEKFKYKNRYIILLEKYNTLENDLKSEKELRQSERKRKRNSKRKPV